MAAAGRGSLYDYLVSMQVSERLRYRLWETYRMPAAGYTQILNWDAEVYTFPAIDHSYINEGFQPGSEPIEFGDAEELSELSAIASYWYDNTTFAAAKPMALQDTVRLYHGLRNIEDWTRRLPSEGHAPTCFYTQNNPLWEWWGPQPRVNHMCDMIVEVIVPPGMYMFASEDKSESGQDERLRLLEDKNDTLIGLCHTLGESQWERPLTALLQEEMQWLKTQEQLWRASGITLRDVILPPCNFRVTNSERVICPAWWNGVDQTPLDIITFDTASEPEYMHFVQIVITEQLPVDTLRELGAGSDDNEVMAMTSLRSGARTFEYKY